MSLSQENRNFLDDIYKEKPNKQVNITRKFYSNEFLELLDNLKECVAIKNLNVHEATLENIYFYKDTPKKKGKIYNISFEVVSWIAINDFSKQEFNKLITEPYGEEKQLKIVKQIITDKSLELENNQFRISNYDFIDDQCHIVFLKVIEKLEKERFLELLNGFFFIGNGRFELDIKLLKDIKKLKKQQGLTNKAKEQKSHQEDKSQLSPKFRFNQGILFRDFCDEILIIKGENALEYRLLQTTFRFPVEERIDALTDNMEMEWRQLYDTAKRLNDKIKNKFKVDDFFNIDYTNKKLCRAIK